MNVYIFKYIDLLTANYHAGGGAVAVADCLGRAVQLIEATNTDPDQPCKISTEVTAVYPCDAVAEAVFIFPDAGCC